MDLSICGENERYSPPVVMFHDFPQNEAGTSSLIFRVDQSTSRSTFLAHYAFVPAQETNPDSNHYETRFRIKGGSKQSGSQGLINLEKFLGVNDGAQNYQGRSRKSLREGVSLHLLQLK